MTVPIYHPVTNIFPGQLLQRSLAIKVTSSEGLLQWTEAKDAQLALPFTHVDGHRSRERLTTANKGQLNDVKCRQIVHPCGE